MSGIFTILSVTLLDISGIVMGSNCVECSIAMGLNFVTFGTNMGLYTLLRIVTIDIVSVGLILFDNDIFDLTPAYSLCLFVPTRIHQMAMSSVIQYWLMFLVV